MEESIRLLIILRQRTASEKGTSLVCLSSPNGGVIPFVNYPVAAPLRQKRDLPLSMFRLVMEESLRLLIILQQRHCARKRNLPNGGVTPFVNYPAAAPLRRKKEPPSIVLSLLMEE